MYSVLLIGVKHPQHSVSDLYSGTQRLKLTSFQTMIQSQNENSSHSPVRAFLVANSRETNSKIWSRNMMKYSRMTRPTYFVEKGIFKRLKENLMMSHARKVQVAHLLTNSQKEMWKMTNSAPRFRPTAEWWSGKSMMNSYSAVTSAPVIGVTIKGAKTHRGLTRACHHHPLAWTSWQMPWRNGTTAKQQHSRVNWVGQFPKSHQLSVQVHKLNIWRCNHTIQWR